MKGMSRLRKKKLQMHQELNGMRKVPNKWKKVTAGSKHPSVRKVTNFMDLTNICQNLPSRRFALVTLACKEKLKECDLNDPRSILT
ncbi:hypothetical protein PR048_002071 [Dryococelus australis]|uniref:Uncharacterized protein n=1 Tax=Dryococelus australis TaxID=614101 RepID=A0ABQ9IJB8_9NEOP|nr:hypothetical protein PR048_002071 [Dryococelus australis]